MRTRKKNILALLLVSLALVGVYMLIVFSSYTISPYIIIINKTQDSGIEFWYNVDNGIAEATSKYSMKVERMATPTEAMIDEQIVLVREAIAKKPTGIILVASDYTALADSAALIINNNIKLITMDSKVNSSNVPHVGTDNVNAGKKAGEVLAPRLSPTENTLILSHKVGVATAIERLQGLMYHLEPERTTVVDCNTDLDIAINETTRILSQDKSYRKIVALNELATRGACTAVKNLIQAKKIAPGEVEIIGFDSSLDVLKDVESGLITATIVQKPFNMGYYSLEAMYNLIYKKEAKSMDTGYVSITKDNMFSTENQRLLFPYKKIVPQK